MYELHVVNRKIEAKIEERPRQLILSKSTG